MQIQYGGTHEYIKRSDVGGFLFLPCDLPDYMGDAMKEHRELQDMLDTLEKVIIEQDNLIEKLEVDAKRYRWLRKYTGQMFMATEQQVDAEVDRAMSGGVK
jgi:ATP phosphoribosyltransferase regulatory subunit HisZ